MPSSELLASLEERAQSQTGHMVLDVLIESMKAIEKVSELKGSQKKTVVVNLIQEKMTLPSVLKALLPYLIDLLIKVDRGEIKFNKKIFTSLYSCCGR